MNDKCIPKVIHYCWFGGKPLPPMALKCIESWEKFFPDYEIKQWDESNVDLDVNIYVRQAYASGKFAFVSDYFRFDVLYRYGGVYFDTDVEVIKPFNEILSRGPFMGFEKYLKGEFGVSGVAPGLGIGAYPGMPIYAEILELYSNIPFFKKNGKPNIITIVEHTTKLLEKHGLKCNNKLQIIDDIVIYPSDYFCPADLETKKVVKTANTHSIHWYAGSWITTYDRIREFVWDILKLMKLR